MALEMAAFSNDSPPMSKEYLRIITITQEGILNIMQIMSNEIAIHTDIILKKNTDLQTPQPDKDKEYKKKLLPRAMKKKYVCFTCGELGHCSLNCTQKAPKKENNKPAIKGNECFNCGEEGHWANTCPNKLKKRCLLHMSRRRTFYQRLSSLRLWLRRKSKSPKN